METIKQKNNNRFFSPTYWHLDQLFDTKQMFLSWKEKYNLKQMRKKRRVLLLRV